MIDVAIATLLRQFAGVGSRVTPATESVLVTQDLPRVVYTVLADPRAYTDSGAMALRKAQYQIDIFAEKGTETRAIAKAITQPATPTPGRVAGIDGFAGTMDQTSIQRIAFGDERPMPGTRIEGQNQTVARCLLELNVWYRELT